MDSAFFTPFPPFRRGRSSSLDPTDPSNFTDQPHHFKDTDDCIANIRLMPGPAQARDPRTSVMISMPVLTLEEMHNSEPSHVAARILAERSIGLAMAYAVHEALRV